MLNRHGDFFLRAWWCETFLCLIGNDEMFCLLCCATGRCDAEMRVVGVIFYQKRVVCGGWLRRGKGDCPPGLIGCILLAVLRPCQKDNTRKKRKENDDEMTMLVIVDHRGNAKKWKYHYFRRL